MTSQDDACECDDGELIERLDAGEPPRSPDEAAVRAPYEQLFRRLRELDEIPPLPGWEERAMARWLEATAMCAAWQAQQRRRRCWLVATAIVAIAVGAAVAIRAIAYVAS